MYSLRVADPARASVRSRPDPLESLVWLQIYSAVIGTQSRHSTQQLGPRAPHELDAVVHQGVDAA